MEKVIFVRNHYEDYEDEDFDNGLEEVNKHLSEGWKVKSVHCNIDEDDDYSMAYFVLEKKEG